MLNGITHILNCLYNKLLISWLEAVQVKLSVSVAKLKHSLLTRHAVLYLSRKLSNTLAFKQKRD